MKQHAPPRAQIPESQGRIIFLPWTPRRRFLRSCRPMWKSSEDSGSLFSSLRSQQWISSRKSSRGRLTVSRWLAGIVPSHKNFKFSKSSSVSSRPMESSKERKFGSPESMGDKIQRWESYEKTPCHIFNLWLVSARIDESEMAISLKLVPSLFECRWLTFVTKWRTGWNCFVFLRKENPCNFWLVRLRLLVFIWNIHYAVQQSYPTHTNRSLSS